MKDWDLLLTDARIATLCEGGSGYGIIENAALAIAGDSIAWLGKMDDLPQPVDCECRSLDNRWLTPALIDCHTHLVFGGDRAAEFEQRLGGASYEEIADSGGGIISTVSATREADRQTLIDSAGGRLATLIGEGVATVEIKSGYGLNAASELNMLESARDLGRQHPATVVTTFLGAHAVPPEYRNRADDYIDFLVDELLPAVHERRLADAVDAFCERIGFSAAQVARVFDKSADLGLPVKLHADQLSDGGGAELAARFGALSADHLEYTSAKGVAAMADAGSVAVMLPGAFLTLGETQLPPIELFREHGVPLAVATDCNPGSSPICSLRAAMSLATSLFSMTPEECLAGVTREAARALGLDDRGTLQTGKRADIAIWDFTHPRELSYWMGLNPLENLLIGGRQVF